MKKLKFIGAMLLSVTFMTSTFAQSEKVDVSDDELEKFVNVYKVVQTENQELQQGMVEMIEEEGMDVERFNEIHSASSSPEGEVDASSEELATHQKVVNKIEKKQSEFQDRVTELIEEEGLTLDRYQEVFQALQADQELQKKFSEMMQG